MSGQQLLVERERERNAVRVGDRFRFSIPAYDFIRREPDQSTVVVVCAEIKVEADGTKTIVVHPE